MTARREPWIALLLLAAGALTAAVATLFGVAGTLQHAAQLIGVIGIMVAAATFIGCPHPFHEPSKEEG